MFNTEPNEFYTITVNGRQLSNKLFQFTEQAIEYIKDNSTWDCRPVDGIMTWYDSGTGTKYEIVSCDDCGRY